MFRPALAIAIAIGLSACSATPAPSSPTSAPTATFHRYPPLAFAADARAADRAVILGADERGSAAVLPLAPGARAVTVLGAGGAIDVATAPGTSRIARVTASGGAAPRAWRAAAWQAAALTAAVLGKDPADIAFTATARGRVDATASSAALTVGFLASRTGARVDARAALLAAIAPDGALAPVADLDAHVRAAIAAGATRIGVVGRARPRVRLPAGVRLFAVDDLAAAYRLVTGATLPAPRPVAADAMAADAPAPAGYAAWQGRLAPRWARALEVDSAGGRPAALTALARSARAAARSAETLRAAQPLAAEDRLAEAWQLALAAAISGDAIDRVAAGDLAGARAALDDVDAVIAIALDADAPTLAPAEAPPLDAALDAVAAAQRAIEARSLASLARNRLIAARSALDRLGQRPRIELPSHAVADEVVAALAPAVLAAARSATAALRGASPRPAAGARVPLVAADLRRRATALQAAAAAVLDAAGRPTRAALSAPPAPPRAVDDRAADATAALIELAAAELAWFEAGALAADQLLGVRRDPVTDLVTGVARPDVLAALLIAAEAGARAQARAARSATGSIPAVARADHARAVARRSGDVTDQRAALALFWRSSAWSRLAIALARSAGAP